jgi:hypothetical protein
VVLGLAVVKLADEELGLGKDNGFDSTRAVSAAIVKSFDMLINTSS